MRTDSTANHNERWPLGIMIVCGYEQHPLADQLEVAKRLVASHVELYPRWGMAPDPAAIGRQVRDAGLTVWSAHGPWGSEAWRAGRVDLGSVDAVRRRDSVADV